MSEERRSFSLDEKRAVLARLAAGVSLSRLAAELGVHRQLIYKWRDADRAGRLGVRRGRPTKAEALVRAAANRDQSELEAARRRVAELERKVGRQELELDFFRGALQRIEALRQLSTKPGATGSSRRSKR